MPVPPPDHVVHAAVTHRSTRRCLRNRASLQVFSGAVLLFTAVMLGGCSGSGPTTYTVAGTVSGMFGSGLVLENSGGDDFYARGNGAFVFSTPLEQGTAYAVTVKTQPTAPIQVCTVTNATGTVGNRNVSNVAVNCGAIALLAGALGGAGSLDGTGTSARFNGPWGTATDSLGNIYVVDSINNTIRKITPDAVVSTLAGSAGQAGSADGPGSAARFNNPLGIAIDSTGNLYVADTDNFTIRKVTPDGVVSTVAGTPGVIGSGDGAGSSAQFDEPHGVATDSKGNLYVADTHNDTIRKITPDGLVSTLAGAAGDPDEADGMGSAAGFTLPTGVAVDSTGNVYVADSDGPTIRKITPDGLVSTLAGRATEFGYADGPGSSALFNSPTAIASDSDGNQYVTDGCMIRKVTPESVVSTLAGSPTVCGYADGPGSSALFDLPEGVTVDSTGNLYIGELGNNTVRKMTPGGVVSTLAGTPIPAGYVNGTGSAARFWGPAGAAVDSAGNVFIADDETIRKITPDAVVSTLAGSAGQDGSADGPGSSARFSNIYGLAIDFAGNVYAADNANCTIRKINPDGVVSTLAGTAGQIGSADGTAGAARFASPSGVATDSMGNVYVADSGNETIRKITPDGVVSTLAGAAGQIGSVDGVGSSARFVYPIDVATDATGNLYVTDQAGTIRKITPNGVVSTLAGTAGQIGSADGTAGAARFASPSGVATDSMGNVYVADTDNHAIRRITPQGVVTTVAGVPGSIGDVLGPLPGSLNGPYYLAVQEGAVVKLVMTDFNERAVLEIMLP
jgi:sugar lactone lactonase YvrE